MKSVGMPSSLGTSLPSSVGSDLLMAAAVSNVEALYQMQNVASEQIATNATQQQKLGQSVIDLTKQLMAEIEKQLQEVQAAQAKEKSNEKAGEIFGMFLTAFTAIGAALLGQPEIAVISIALLTMQQMKVTDKIEHAIGGDHAWAKALVGVGIAATCALMGGGASALRGGAKLAILGTSLMAGTAGLMGAGVQGNVIEATGLEGKGGAIGVQAAFMALGLAGGLAGGALLAKSGATVLSNMEVWRQRLFQFSLAGGAMSMGGQAYVGASSAYYLFKQADATGIKREASALMQLSEELKNMNVSQSGHYTKVMADIMNTAGKQAVKVSDGASSAEMFAAQLAANA